MMKKKFFAVAIATTMALSSAMTAMAEDVSYYSFDTDASFIKIAGCSDRQTDLGAALTYIDEFVQQV